MITFKQFLSEALDSKVEITNLNDHGTFGGDVYTFVISGKTYFIFLQQSGNQIESTFGIGDPYKLNSPTSRADAFAATTSNRDQFKIISTVVNGLIDHFKRKPLSGKQELYFSAEGQSRARLYETIAKRVAAKFNLRLKKIQAGSKAYFVVGQNDHI